jgi:hypothetical protein
VPSPQETYEELLQLVSRATRERALTSAQSG